MEPYCKKTADLIRRVAEHTREGGDKLDQNILVLLDALNRVPGIHTNWSCGGHADKKRFPYISFTFDDPTTGVANLAKVAHAAEQSDWITKFVGRDLWAPKGGYFEGEFELFPQIVIRQSGQVRGSIQSATAEEILHEQNQIAEIAERIRVLTADPRASQIQTPNTIL